MQLGLAKFGLHMHGEHTINCMGGVGKGSHWLNSSLEQVDC